MVPFRRGAIVLDERLGRPRPRQGHTDCMLMVFRYITGADAAVTLARFCPYMEGQEGMSLDALTACLREEGYTLAPYEEAAEMSGRDDGVVDRDALAQFWRPFQGQAVMLYGPQGQMQHAVLVCSGGLCFDPSIVSPEDGEFIVDHFDRNGWDGNSLRVLRVTRR